jgi:hypothetical protein
MATLLPDRVWALQTIWLVGEDDFCSTPSLNGFIGRPHGGRI